MHTKVVVCTWTCAFAYHKSSRFKYSCTNINFSAEDINTEHVRAFWRRVLLPAGKGDVVPSVLVGVAQSLK